MTTSLNNERQKAKGLEKASDGACYCDHCEVTPSGGAVCVQTNLVSFTQVSSKKSMKQQQQRGKAAGLKEPNSTAEKIFTESDQDVSDQHTMQGLQVHTSVQQRGLPSLVYSDDLFDKWPPLADMEGRLQADELAQIKAEMRGQPMQGPRPTIEDLKEWGLTCAEQYHIYDTYWLW